ncbi:hypothetical protein [Actinomadura litoris]|uniref:hypothetical protein n=1 Tax=Actinomadura litoris TaxID=2678616 RepID=UPI001FA7147B|nr:hypothetical protein [Actinomadura litoris]
MSHHVESDRLIVAHLEGAATRHAGWRNPEGPAREAALQELRTIATVASPGRRGSPHQPAAELRADLLAEVAGILLGFAAVDSHPEQKVIAATLLIEAGADAVEVARWEQVGLERAAAPLVGPAHAGSARWPGASTAHG